MGNDLGDTVGSTGERGIAEAVAAEGSGEELRGLWCGLGMEVGRSWGTAAGM